MAQPVEDQADICPLCGGLVVSFWIPGGGCISHPDYVLIADWVIHSACYDKSVQNYESTMMARVLCKIDEVELENDNGHMIDGVEATCSKCGHSTESFGTSETSVKRCLVLLREECPEGEENYYVNEDE